MCKEALPDPWRKYSLAEPMPAYACRKRPEPSERKRCVMTRHPWVALGDEGVRFGILVPGGRRHSPTDGWVCDGDPLSRYLEAGTLAERLGFDAVFASDYSWIFPDPFVYLAALAAVTERIYLGTAVIAIYLRHPSHLGRLVADLSVGSRGRFVLGVGIGESEDQLRSVDVPIRPVPERQDAVAEALQIVRGTWGDEAFAYDGRYFRTARARSIPPPAVPGPPIVIGGGGKRTLRQVARLGDACNFGGTWDAVTPEEVRERLALLRAQCAAEGRPYDEILRTHLSMLVIASSETQLREKLTRFFRPESAEYMQKIGWLVAGTPDFVAEYYAARAEAGMQYFITHLADTEDEETMRLLAEEVFPAVCRSGE